MAALSRVARKAKAPKLVVLGGGTGSFTLLQGLKELTPHITAIVNMSDDGGSTGTLRDEYGVLPPGDIRQCLVALSDTPEVRDLFSYRFSEGQMKGHTVGNLILSALEMQYGSFSKAVQVASDILHIQGHVIPVTLDKHTLVAEDGKQTYYGEHIIDGAIRLGKKATLRLKPEAQLNPLARDALLAADMIVIAPGSFYTSLVPILAVTGMRQVLMASSAKLVSVINLVNKPLQADGWHVVDYIEQMERYIGQGRIDVGLYNTEPISRQLLKKYAAEGEFPVATDKARFTEVSARLVGARLVSKAISARQAGDTVQRSFIRHDAARVCAELRKLLA